MIPMQEGGYTAPGVEDSSSGLFGTDWITNR